MCHPVGLVGRTGVPSIFASPLSPAWPPFSSVHSLRMNGIFLGATPLTESERGKERERGRKGEREEKEACTAATLVNSSSSPPTAEEPHSRGELAIFLLLFFLVFFSFLRLS